MSESFAVQFLADPAPEFRGQFTTTSTSTFGRTAREWCPRGVRLEPPVATVSRYTVRMIDNRTGYAYSVEELEEYFAAQVGAVFSVSGKTGTVMLVLDDVDGLVESLESKVPAPIENEGPPSLVSSTKIPLGITYNGNDVGPLVIPRVGEFNGRDFFKLVDPDEEANAFFVYWSIVGSSWVLFYAPEDSVPEDGSAIWGAQNFLDTPYPEGSFFAQFPEDLSGTSVVTYNPITEAFPGQIVVDTTDTSFLYFCIAPGSFAKVARV